MREAAFEIASQSDAFAPTIARQLVSAVMQPVIFIRDAWMLANVRSLLHRLDDRQLEDIGITRLDIDALGVNGLETSGALDKLITERRMPARSAEIIRFRRRATDCAWTCTAR